MPKKIQEKTEDLIKNFFENTLTDEQSEVRGFRLKTFLYIFLSTIVLVALVAIFLLGYQRYYRGKIYPGVYANNYHLGGLTGEQAQNFIENYNNRLVREGIDFTATKVDGSIVSFKLNNLDGVDNAPELIKIDSERLVGQAMRFGRTGDWFDDSWQPIIRRFFWPETIEVPVTINEVAFREVLKTYLAPMESGGRNANIKITNLEDFSFEVLLEQSGGVFMYEKIMPAVRDHVADLSFAPIEIKQDLFVPDVLGADAYKAAEKLSSLFGYGELGLNYINPQTNIRRDWSIGPREYADWLEITRDGENNLVFVLNEEKVKKYLDILRTDVDESEQNAKFVMEDGKVKEFQASRSGLRLNLNKTYESINNAFKERNYRSSEVTKTVGLVVDMVDPQIKMAEVNDLGITGIIGVGYSTFRDSHNNRIRNIANAVKRLNGTLVKPGEIFSAIKYAGPFTTANGFLPEAVIKGRDIKNEVGGGMCQIGTTLFRMAMNSGMDIVERHNHSLVVNYYSDPVNGNPGTDAALYEPIVDLKFNNDTGNYLLLQTDIDYKKQMLTFTLWGKPDGRKGEYTHPIVSRWIAAGEPQEILVSKEPQVKVGEKKCQVAYRGAVASFTYTRITPSGEKIDRVFESYYRPLPKICMIGVEALPEGCKEKESCASYGQAVSASTTLPVGE